jgi:hypothetical protein
MRHERRVKQIAAGNAGRPLEESGKLLHDLATAEAILDRFLHDAQSIAITGRTYRLKDHAIVAGKEDKNRTVKSKPNEPSDTPRSSGRFARQVSIERPLAHHLSPQDDKPQLRLPRKREPRLAIPQ